MWTVTASGRTHRYLACAALLIAACTETTTSGSSGTTTTTTSTTTPARPLDVNVHESQTGVVANNVTCSFDGDRQLLASGVVRNAGGVEAFVSIEVRFVDADAVRVELATDSVSALQPDESARWDVTSYPSAAAEATGCVVSVDVS